MDENLAVNLGRARLSGNQSVAWGAVEAGVRVATGYPGAPISDLQGSFEQLAGNLPRTNLFTTRAGPALDRANYQLTAHWGDTTNEDNAMMFALGAVLCKGDFKVREFITEKEWQLIYGGTVVAADAQKRVPVGGRVMCSFKHLGANTAADAIRVAMNVVPYTGGLGIASGDDRQGTASQTMQDNKVLFAFHFRMPTFELHSPLNAQRTVRNCYRLFEELGVPFALIMNYDLCYREVDMDLDINIDLRSNRRLKGFTRDPMHLVTIGPHIRPREKWFHSNLLALLKKKMKEYFELLGNRVEVVGSNPANMLVLNGPFREDFQLVKRDPTLMARLVDKYGDVLVVESSLVFPQPDSLYESLVSENPIKNIYVFEEGYGRVIYLQLLDMVNQLGLDVRVFDRGIPFEPRIYERFSYADHLLTV